jgi:hypothetical protein
MKKNDLLWFLAYPIYQIIGTIRHEAGHALVAWLQGAEINKFVFFPGMHGDIFYWGYVQWTGQTGWTATAAPYFLDLLTFVVFFLICFRLPFKRHWLWLNLVILGMVSPLANSAYAYLRSFASFGNDVVRLLDVLPAWPVHAYFVFTLILYIVGLVLVFRRSRHLTTDI